MRLYGYLRASTKEQDAQRAKDSLVDFSSAHNFTITAFFTENASGAKLDRPELRRLLEICAPGDAIVVESIDRLSRLSESDWSILRSMLKEKQIRIIAHDIPTTYALTQFNSEITSSIMGLINDLLIDLMAIFSRRDYDLRAKRQKEGVQKAKMAGKYKGRPRDTRKRERIANFLSTKKEDGTDYSWSEIQSIIPCSRGLIAQVKRDMK